MRLLVRKFVRGLLVGLAAVVVWGCVGVPGDGSRWPTVDQAGDEAVGGIDAIRLRVARNAMKNGDYDTAIRFFTSIQEDSPGHLAPLMGLGEANLAKRDFEAAETAFRKAMQGFPRRAETYEGLGRVLVAKGDYKGAIEAFNHALARAPSAALHNKLGVAHDLMGDGEGAQRHYRAALLLDPDAVSARNNLALSLAISEKYDQAISEMEKVAATPGAADRYRDNLAFVYGMAGKLDAAARVLGKPAYGSAARARNEALFTKIRGLAKAGDRHAVLAYLNGEKEAVSMSAPAMQTAALPAKQPSAAGTGKAPKPAAVAEKADKAIPRATGAARKAPRTQKTQKMARLSPPAAPAEPTAPEVVEDGGDKAAGMGWRLQLASYRSEARAQRGRKILEKLLGDKVSGLEVLVRRDHRAGSRAIDFRLRTAALSSRADGLRLCAEIRAAGYRGCLVILHNPNLWQATAPAEKKPMVANREYRVQLASYRTERGAERGRKALARVLGHKVVAQFDILVRRDHDEHAHRRSFDYRIRSKPMMTRDEATRICAAIHKAGHSGCLIIRHNDRLWQTATEAPSKHAAAQSAFRVQLASYKMRKSAAVARKKLEKLVEKRVGNIDISVKKVSIKPLNKTFYRVRTAPLESRGEATRLCAALRAAGHTGCWILKV